LTPKKYHKSTVFHEEIYYAGRKMDVKENRGEEDQQMDRCNSLSTQKLMERSFKLKKKFELKQRG
jgi:hypothetical protein